MQSVADAAMDRIKVRVEKGAREEEEEGGWSVVGKKASGRGQFELRLG